MAQKNSHIIKIFTIIILFSILFPIISNSKKSDEFEFRTVFNNENNYIKYVTEKVHFKNISFKIIAINKGDNFWKIAKKNSVNIDTLIGCNPFWKNLLARIDQKILVPSEKGVLHFVYSPGDAEKLHELYKTDKKNIVIEKLPFMYGLFSHFFSSRPLIAVFIKEAKPAPINMTEALAGQFKLREMFRSPLGGRYSSFYGMRSHPVSGKRKFHNGIDIAARYGTLVGASRSGTVISTGWMGGYGKTVIIKHDKGYKTLYGHLSKINTRRGRKVKTGSIIGKVGSTGLSTGPHLHFTVWHRKKALNPMNLLW